MAIHAGTKSITANYGGDTRFQPSTSTPITLTVNKVGTRLEHMVRTDAFADQAAWFAELNRRRTEMAQSFSRWWLHFWNLPTASDVAALGEIW